MVVPSLQADLQTVLFLDLQQGLGVPTGIGFDIDHDVGHRSIPEAGLPCDKSRSTRHAGTPVYKIRRVEEQSREPVGPGRPRPAVRRSRRWGESPSTVLRAGSSVHWKKGRAA